MVCNFEIISRSVPIKDLFYYNVVPNEWLVIRYTLIQLTNIRELSNSNSLRRKYVADLEIELIVAEHLIRSSSIIFVDLDS